MSTDPLDMRWPKQPCHCGRVYDYAMQVRFCDHGASEARDQAYADGVRDGMQLLHAIIAMGQAIRERCTVAYFEESPLVVRQTPPAMPILNIPWPRSE